MGNMLLRFSIKFPVNGPLAEQRLWRRLALILRSLSFHFILSFISWYKERSPGSPETGDDPELIISLQQQLCGAGERLSCNERLI